jgi:hypothetical protein
MLTHPVSLRVSPPVAPTFSETRLPTSPGRPRARAALWITLILCLVSLVWVSGCAPGQVRKLTPAVIDSGLATLASPTNQERLRLLSSIPDLQMTGSNSARGLVHGYLDTLSESNRLNQLDLLTRAFTDQITAALTNAIEAKLGPSLRKETAAMARDLTGALLAPDNERAVGAFTASITSNSLQSFTRGLDQELSPAVRRSLTNQLGPGLSELVRHDLTPALSEGARAMTREAALGIGDALKSSLGTTLTNAQEFFWNRLDRTLDRSKASAQFWLYLVLGISLLLALLLGSVALLWRSQAAAGRRREDALRLVTSAVANVQRNGSIDDLLREIKSQGQKEHLEGYACLSEFLARHQDLKLRTPGK